MVSLLQLKPETTLADLAAAYADGTVRTTHGQNLVLRWVPTRSVPELYRQLAAAGLEALDRRVEDGQVGRRVVEERRQRARRPEVAPRRVEDGEHRGGVGRRDGFYAVEIVVCPGVRGGIVVVLVRQQAVRVVGIVSTRAERAADIRELLLRRHVGIHVSRRVRVGICHRSSASE